MWMIAGGIVLGAVVLWSLVVIADFVLDAVWLDWWKVKRDGLH